MEIWGPYVEAYKLRQFYEQVVVGDIRYLDWRHFLPLDLVICGDVIEHMTKEEGLGVLQRGLTHARVVLVSIPIVDCEQGESHGNPFEVHVKPDWSHEECLSSLPAVCVARAAPLIGVYVLSNSEEDRACLVSIARKLAETGISDIL